MHYVLYIYVCIYIYIYTHIYIFTFTLIPDLPNNPIRPIMYLTNNETASQKDKVIEAPGWLS